MRELMSLLNGVVHPKHVPELMHRFPFWLGFAGNRFVEAFSVQSGAFGNLTHSVIFYPVRQGDNEQPRVFIVQSVLHVVADFLFSFEVVKRIIWFSFYGHFLLLQFIAYFLSSVNHCGLSFFAAFVSAAKQQDHFFISYSVVNAIALANKKTQLPKVGGQLLAVSKLPQGLNAFQAVGDGCNCFSITQNFKPSFKFKC